MVIISVLSDQVNPAWRAKQARLSAVPLAKGVSKPV
jgi:hypothetical protein